VKLSTDTKVIAAGAVLIALAAWWTSRKLTGAATAAGEWAAQNLNPASEQNLAYRGTNAVVTAATGREETLGGWLWSVFNDDPMAVMEAQERARRPIQSGLTAAQAQAARSAYAAQDPRRLDLGPASLEEQAWIYF